MNVEQQEEARHEIPPTPPHHHTALHPARCCAGCAYRCADLHANVARGGTRPAANTRRATRFSGRDLGNQLLSSLRHKSDVAEPRGSRRRSKDHCRRLSSNQAQKSTRTKLSQKLAGDNISTIKTMFAMQHLEQLTRYH
jgi:hypothetical protein